MMVDYTPEALANLDEIWDRNAEQYGLRYFHTAHDWQNKLSEEMP